MIKSPIILLLCLITFLNPSTAEADEVENDRTSQNPSFSGNVSWYGPKFHGKRTASGERFDMYKCTSAHRRLPFHTRVLLEDPRTGNACIVKVNDRGPFCKSRVMDVSKAAAKKLAILGRGVAFLECTILPAHSSR